MSQSQSGIRAQCSQQEVDDFLLNDDNFEKLYNRLGENDDLRKLYEIAFGFSKKVVVLPQPIIKLFKVIII